MKQKITLFLMCLTVCAMAQKGSTEILSNHQFQTLENQFKQKFEAEQSRFDQSLPKDFSTVTTKSVEQTNTLKNSSLLSEQEELPDSAISKKIDWNSNELKLDEKTTFSFNSEDGMFTETYYSWDSDSVDWQLDSKKDYSAEDKEGYDTYECEANYSWNREKTIWEGYDKYEHGIKNYDDSTITLDIRYVWDAESTSWVNSYKDESLEIRNDTSSFNLYTSYRWNAESASWIAGSKSESKSSENDSLFIWQEIVYNWDTQTSAWIYTRKTKGYYHKKNNSQSESDSLWNNTTFLWENALKDEYTYDINNRDSIVVTLYRESISSEWQENSKMEYSYDEDGNIITQILEEGSYKQKAEYTYDEDGNRISYISFENNYGDWDKNSKGDFFFDVNGNQIAYVYFYWDGSDWETRNYDYSYDLVYNNKSQLTSRFYYKWSNNSWSDKSYKDEYTYDNEKNRTSLISSEREDDDSNWKYLSKEEWVYNAEGRQTLNTTYHWDGTMWQGDTKYEWDYNANDREILNISYYWDTDNNAWIGSEKSERTYASNGYETVVEKRYSWSSESSDWEITYSKGPVYDEKGRLISYTEKNRGDISSDFSIQSEITYYYSLKDPASLDASLALDASITLYPNPTTDYIKISATSDLSAFSFKLYDTQGHNVINKQVNTQENISVQNLSSGVYLYSISAKGKITQGKLVIK